MKKYSSFRFKIYPLAKVLAGILVLTLLLGLLTGCIPNSSTTSTSTSTVPTPTTNTTTTTSTQPTISSTTTSSPTGPIPTPFYKAPVDISASSNGQTIRVNLVRFIGKLFSPDTHVMINNLPVKVDTQGNYYVYLDLKKGQNVIEVKTARGADTKTDNVKIFFDPKVNYLENPKITINGDVSNPLAKAEVNGKTQEVRTDGKFTSSYSCVKGGNQVMLVATLDDEIDTYMLRWQVADNGHTGIIPGNYYSPNSPYNNSYLTSLIESDHNGFLFADDYQQTINLKAGESTVLNFGISTGKGNTVPLAASVALRGNPVPNLQVKVEPVSYTAYPKIQYYSPVSISASLQCPPGDYQYSITYSDSKTNLTLGLTVSVK